VITVDDGAKEQCVLLVKFQCVCTSYEMSRFVSSKYKLILRAIESKLEVIFVFPIDISHQLVLSFRENVMAPFPASWRSLSSRP
jgi:hypothetical protein